MVNAHIRVGPRFGERRLPALARADVFRVEALVLRGYRVRNGIVVDEDYRAARGNRCAIGDELRILQVNRQRRRRLRALTDRDADCGNEQKGEEAHDNF